MKVRYSPIAGSWYAGTSESLKKQVEGCFTSKLGPGSLPTIGARESRTILALVSPHAGLMYSGAVAAHGYFELAQDPRPQSFVILGPNHRGLGSAVAISVEGVWRTPFGDAKIDSELAKAILENSSIIDVDDLAHKYEHSIEIQLPFLQYLYGPSVRFVPICMALQDLKTSREVGEAISSAIRGRDVVVIASTDLSHYEPQQVAEEKDRAAIQAVLDLSEEKLQRVVYERDVTMCGYGPVSAALVAAKHLGAKSAKLLKYATSGDVIGDYSSVVGYSSIAIYLV